MKVELKDFQSDAVTRLLTQFRRARAEVNEGARQAIVLASPTGSGKTLMVTRLLELIAQGTDSVAPDPQATFLWLSDQPELNEQSRRKIVATSSVFGPDDLITIDNDFDEERFRPHRVYFLNVQKLGRDRQLVTPGDDRTFTIWQTINNTVAALKGSFVLIIDEAHKGMHQRAADIAAAQTIVQKFIKGSDAEPRPVPLLLGISATPTRFRRLLADVPDILQRDVTVDISDVRASGLIKEQVVVYHTEGATTTDWTLLRDAAEDWIRVSDRWRAYCAVEGLPPVDSLFVVQVEDASARRASGTDLGQALEVIESVAGPLPDTSFAHAFQETTSIPAGDRSLRRIAPPDIQDDTQLRVVFFKLGLNTGWDCPRAEVMMSFRRAADHTAIAQLIGRMVRTPLARRVDRDELLNVVALYLPHYDRTNVGQIVGALNRPGDEQVASDVIEGSTFVPELPRAPGSETTFAALEGIPRYRVTRTPKLSDVRRLIALGRYLEQDELLAGAGATSRAVVIDALRDALTAKSGNSDFRDAITGAAEVELRSVAIVLGADVVSESTRMLRLTETNLDELFAAVGRRLGEGLHLDFVRRRSEEGQFIQLAKQELIVLLADVNLWQSLETLSQERLAAWLATYQPQINGLTEEARARYTKVRRTSRRPEPEPLKLPPSITGAKTDQVWEKHVFTDGDGKYPCSLTGWERPVLEAELRRPEVKSWLRNPPRKEWSFSVTYKDEHGDDTNMYPDFLLVRNEGQGPIVDILEPHREDEGDAARKLVGLAEYVDRHGDQLGRVLMISKGPDGVFREINLSDEPTRQAAKIVTTTSSVVALFSNFGQPRAGAA